MRYAAVATGFLLAASVFAQAAVPRPPVIAEYGACAARQSTGLARALMTTAMDSHDEERRARQLVQASGSCLRNRPGMSFRTGEVRGTVAEALLEREPDALARLAAIPARPGVRAEAAEGRRFVANYARCLADAEPAKAAAMLATGHQSPEEHNALLVFGDTLNDCMPMGIAYPINRFDVRNHIAARLYEIAFPASSEGAR